MLDTFSCTSDPGEVHRIASDRRVMGAATSGWLSRVILMITFIGMAGAVVALVLSSLHG